MTKHIVMYAVIVHQKKKNSCTMLNKIYFMVRTKKIKLKKAVSPRIVFTGYLKLFIVFFFNKHQTVFIPHYLLHKRL